MLEKTSRLGEEAETDPVDPEALSYQRPSPVEYARLVPDVPPIGGRIRVELEDFRVEEIPLYSFSGRGEHCYITIVKTNRTTLQVRQYLAGALGVGEEDIGFAGFKDRRAITRQTFSVPGVGLEDLRGLERPWLEVVDATHHTNKIRTGHLAGNHFTIKIRDVRPGSGEAVRRILERLDRTGLPNFFGPQRFGYFGDSYRVGCSLLHRDPKSAITALLAPRDQHREAFRLYFEQGRYQHALGVLPPGRRSEAAILNALRRYPGNYRAAARRIPHQMKRMFFSAYQSFLFNWCLKERMEWGSRAFADLLPGDLAYVHRHGAAFLVEDVEEERHRLEAGDISPSGPMFGRRMAFPKGREGALEQAVLDAEGLRPQSFLSHVKGMKLNGSRRPYRIPLEPVEYHEEDDGGSIVLSFTLPPGSYATMLLEQLMGTDGVSDADADNETLSRPASS